MRFATQTRVLRAPPKLVKSPKTGKTRIVLITNPCCLGRGTTESDQQIFLPIKSHTPGPPQTARRPSGRLHAGNTRLLARPSPDPAATPAGRSERPRNKPRGQIEQRGGRATGPDETRLRPQGQRRDERQIWGGAQGHGALPDETSGESDEDDGGRGYGGGSESEIGVSDSIRLWRGEKGRAGQGRGGWAREGLGGGGL